MVNRDGRFKVADGGTLFLDKVGHASGHDEPWGWNERGQFLEEASGVTTRCVEPSGAGRRIW